MTIVMYDSITVSEIPANAPAVAGYTGGHWPTWNEVQAKFPDAQHLSIAISASSWGRCLDCEPGDATPSQAPGWFNAHADHSHGLPVLYASASAVNEVVTAMSHAGIARDKYLIWSAHYTFHEHICSPSGCGYPQADATQWTDKAMGRNLDQSLCSDKFFTIHPTPLPPTPEGTMAIAVGSNADGRLAVFIEMASGEVKHIEQQKPNGEWWKDNKGHYHWLTLGNPSK